MARPKKTTKNLPKNWRTIIFDEMCEGASKQEIKTLLGISNDLFDRLSKEDEEFSETIKRGINLSESWWLKQGRVHLNDRKFNAVLWYMNMKNRFGWRDRQETELRTEGESLGVVYLPPKASNLVQTM